jgi:hypothetical protein
MEKRERQAHLATAMTMFGAVGMTYWQSGRRRNRNRRDRGGSDRPFSGDSNFTAPRLHPGITQEVASNESSERQRRLRDK